jgi:aspartate/methionine/tyrosine aminotransferase
MALMNPGDEVLIPEPFYENYGPDAILAGASPVFVPLERPDWKLDPDRLRKAFTKRTRAIIVNTPHNPTGRVLTRDEMSLIAELCIEHDAWAITDAPYEHMVYSGHHHEMATWPGMRERTITISSLSKTYSCTGWRIGWIIAPPARRPSGNRELCGSVPSAPAPLQAAAAVGFAFGAEYYNHFSNDYRARREFLCRVLDEVGFTFSVPEGAYYIFADFSRLSDLDDVTFAKWMAQEIGVATVPGSSFYSNREDGRTFVRFAFCKKFETLEHAEQKLNRLPEALRARV